MCECDSACGGENFVINIRIDKLVINYEDQCTYVEHVYMEDDIEGDEIFLDSEE